MPTPTEVIEQVIDPLPEEVDELTRAIEGDLVHIQGPETITGLKTFTQPITAPEFVGVLSGHLAAGVQALGPIDMNGFGFTNVSGTGFELLTNKGAANGYAPLGPAALVPQANLGTGSTGTGTNFLADDGTYKPISAGAVSFGTQNANRIFAGPGSGSAAAPGFRALVAADIPALEESAITGLVADLAAKVPTSRTITEGAGLAGNVYNLSANRALALGTPSTLSAQSLNSASGTTHSHAILASSNPGIEASLLATDASGYLTLIRLTLLDRLLINAATSNLFLKDTSTGFQVSTTGIVNPQAGNAFRSTTFTSGIQGWNIDDDGNAEFNNLRARGAIISSVFQVSEISATAGTLGVFYSAATIHADFTTPASTSSSFTFQAKNSDAGGMLFAVGDIIRFKTWTGSGISDSWATITARTNNTTYTSYTATLNSGSTSATYRAGSAAVDYGPSGTGFITLSADGTVGSSPNLTMATHAGLPWSAQTPLLRLGNLNGYGGYGTVYGLAVGNTTGSWLAVDSTFGVRFLSSLTTIGQWDMSGNITVGQAASGYSNVYITSGGTLQVRVGTNIWGQWDSTGVIIGEPASRRLTLDATNGFRVFSGATTVVGQWDASGNATFGQVATNQANVYWNNSNKRLEFRGSTNGTVVQSYVDTDGSIKVGTNVYLDSGGINIYARSSTSINLAFRSPLDNTELGHFALTESLSGGGTIHDIEQAEIVVKNGASQNSIQLGVGAGSGAQFSLTDRSGASLSNYANMSGITGFAIGAVLIPTEMFDVTGRVMIRNTSAPSTPSGGGILYTESGALKYKGSSGTVTTVANA